MTTLEELDALVQVLRNKFPDVYEWEQAADAIVSLRDRVEQLESLQDAEIELAAIDDRTAQWLCRAEKAEQDRDAALTDARRYRWLRQRNDEVAGGVAANIRVKYRCVESELDAAIDAAMIAGKNHVTG